MSTITTIASGDNISNSRTDINTNFANLNADKMETSVLDTDTALTANSDAKVATQKAVKAYVDGVGVANASTTVRGVVEVATQAQHDAGTATGETGASIVVTPALIKASTNPIIRKYISSDSPATWTKPAGLKYVIVEVQGAGGDGVVDGAGGGGGGYSRKVVAVASLGATETVTIGAGGVGSGNTSFGTHAIGGNGADGSSGTGGAGGTASSGDLNINGQAGHTKINGGGGGWAVLGGGGQSTNSTSTTGTESGSGGGGYGGGGGGSSPATDGFPSGAGAGAGAGGIVVVTEYYS